MTAKPEPSNESSNFIVTEINEILKNLERDSFFILSYSTYCKADKNGKVHYYEIKGDNYISDTGINIDYHCSNITRNLTKLATIFPGIKMKERFKTAVYKSIYYDNRRKIDCDEKEALRSLYDDLGAITVYAKMLKKKALEYEDAKDSFHKLNINEITESLVENQKPMNNIKKYLANVNETIRRDGQLQFLWDDWNKLTSALELASMYRASEMLRRCMDVFNSRYEDKTTIGEMEKINREEINSILNKLKMALDDCSIEC